ncbi:hypothetical protein L1987_15717 [Smallanthus sonchifolius]|uniref:Uncharacterized protein n=1 Tax=Smallanthus sonchifolius TaxID=185202 RepID=A0ACB9J7D5_9ASTR|nr:hypothetical protein L1987_15717 [Smallanthus sonchifolius]
MLCVHPDKVQQKGANVQQKYTAEKVFDLLNVLPLNRIWSLRLLEVHYSIICFLAFFFPFFKKFNFERVYDVDAMNNGQVVGTIEKDVKGRLYPTIVAHIHNEE